MAMVNLLDRNLVEVETEMEKRDLKVKILLLQRVLNQQFSKILILIV